MKTHTIPIYAIRDHSITDSGIVWNPSGLRVSLVEGRKGLYFTVRQRRHYVRYILELIKERGYDELYKEPVYRSMPNTNKKVGVHTKRVQEGRSEKPTSPMEDGRDRGESCCLLDNKAHTWEE